MPAPSSRATATERAPWISSIRRYTSPCLLIAPSRRRNALRVFLGRQAEKARELAARGKPPDVADERDERRRGEQADARDGLQQRDIGQSARERGELPFDRAHVASRASRSRHTPPRESRAGGSAPPVDSASSFADPGHDVLRADAG